MKTLQIIFVFCLLTLMPMLAQAQFLNNPVIAHRGAWKNDSIPQNSIASLQRAIELGCSGTEFDVHYTKDNVLVVNHDADFYGVDIATSTYEELLKVKHPNGESIPKAGDYIKLGMEQKQTKLIFELKTSPLGLDRTLESAKAAVALVHELGAQEWIEYILFSYDGAKEIIALDPTAKVSYLSGDVTPLQAKTDGLYGLDYHFKIYQTHPSWIQEAKKLGLVINSWTVNNAETMQDLLNQEAEYITTDQPELLIEIWKQQIQANHTNTK